MSEKAGIAIDEEMARLEQQAEALANEYWQKHWAVRNEADRSEWGFIGARARLKDGGLEISWFRARYWRNRNKAGEKRSPSLQYLKKGQGYCYTEAAFRKVKAKQWEIDKAMELEVHFGALRRQAAMLGKMRRYLHEYRKACAESPVPTGDNNPDLPLGEPDAA